MVRDAARDYAEGRLAPRVLEAFRHEQTDPAIFREMGASGFSGATIPEEFGGGGLNYVSYGLIAREVERVDSGYRSMMSVQSSLVMLPIERSEARLRSEVSARAGPRRIDRLLRPHRARPWLRSRQHGHPRARRGRLFASGAKTWITNSPIADVFVVWAKTEDEVIRGFILEKGFQGLSAPAIHGKVGLRASITGQIVWMRCSSRRRICCRASAV